MGREIITNRSRVSDAGSGGGGTDRYRDRLLKYIPGEVVVAWGTIQGIVEQAQSSSTPPDKHQITVILWIVFAVLLIATPLYQWKLLKVRKPVQLAVATIGFAVWVFYFGGPFATFGWYEPLYGAIALPLFTFLIPLLEPD